MRQFHLVQYIVFGVEVDSRNNALLTTGLEKWSSARPRSIVRSELWVLVPENSSSLASEKRATWHKAVFFL